MGQKRILVIKVEGLTQFVEAEPVFASIRRAHPDAHIDLLTCHSFGRLAKGGGYFDRVLAAGPFADQAARKNFLKQLKKQGYGRVVDLDGTRLSGDIRKALSGWRKADWVGPRRMLNNNIDPHEFVPSFAGPAMRKMLIDAGIEVEDRLPNLSFALEGRKDAANMRPSWYGISGEFGLLQPAHDPARRWPAAHYAQLASDLVLRGVTPVLLGNEEMTTFGNDVTQMMVRTGPQGGARALVDLTAKTDLAQQVALAREAKFFVGGIADDVYLTISVDCPGLLLLHPDDVADTEALVGRRIVCMTAEDMTALEPSSVLNMLEAMGVLARDQAQNDRRMAKIC